MFVPVMSAGHQVGRELDARKIGAEHAGERAHQQGFGDAWYPLHKGVVLPGENDDVCLFDDVAAGL